MFTCTPATRIFVALDPVDLRASFNGLCAWVQQKLAEDPLGEICQEVVYEGEGKACA